jgi:hypothetical protein
VIVGGLVFPQLSLIPVAAAASTAHKRLFAGVDADMSDVALAPQETFAAGGALVW